MTIAPGWPCVISDDEKYRYVLWRPMPTKHRETDPFSWKIREEDRPTCPYLMIIGLNPSIATWDVEDPTMRREWDFTQQFGFGALCKVNAFAWRETSPAKMKAIPRWRADVVGPDNDKWIRECAAGAAMVICAWGAHGGHRGRDREVLRIICEVRDDFYHLGFTKGGLPRHPLMLKKTTWPELWLGEMPSRCACGARAYVKLIGEESGEEYTHCFSCRDIAEATRLDIPTFLKMRPPFRVRS